MAEDQKAPLRRLGRRIKQLRKRRHLSQDQLAERAGISSKHLSEIERGNANITMLAIIAIANSLSVDVAELVRGIGTGAEQTYTITQQDYEGMEAVWRAVESQRVKRAGRRRSR